MKKKLMKENVDIVAKYSKRGSLVGMTKEGSVTSVGLAIKCHVHTLYQKEIKLNLMSQYIVNKLEIIIKGHPFS